MTQAMKDAAKDAAKDAPEDLPVKSVASIDPQQVLQAAIETGQISVSLLQRRFLLPYGAALNLFERTRDEAALTIGADAFDRIYQRGLADMDSSSK